MFERGGTTMYEIGIGKMATGFTVDIIAKQLKSIGVGLFKLTIARIS